MFFSLLWINIEVRGVPYNIACYVHAATCTSYSLCNVAMEREYVIVMSVEEFLLFVILIDCDWFPRLKCTIER